MTDTEHDLVEVTITAPDPDWLADLCHQLVDARLASSAHVIHPIASIYRWEGDVHKTTEARASLRSRLALFDEVASRVAELHPYEVPNITAVPLVAGYGPYLRWIATSTSSDSVSAREPIEQPPPSTNN